MPPRTLKQARLGKIGLRVVQLEDGGLVGRYKRPDRPGKNVPGDLGETVEELWERVINVALREDPSYCGYDGAITRFLGIFREGFEDPLYLEQERNYKERARALLNETVPIAEAANGTDCVEEIVAAYTATNLVDPRWERPRIFEALRSDNGQRLVQHLANFALGDWRRLAAIAAICKPFRAGIWPIVTYLPFLWESGNEHALLRYTPAVSFAGNVGHPFPEVYEASLNPDVYRSLLDLYARTAKEIAELSPRDVIDVQSFVWVVSEYEDER